MKKILFAFIAVSILIGFSSCNENKKEDTQTKVENTDVSTSAQVTTPEIDPNVETLVKNIDSEEFIELVFDYKNNKDWKYNGTVPCIVDFYADWCRPCKMVAPIMDELSLEYNGKVLFYKVDVDANQDLAGAFGIQSIPSVLFIPVSGQPQMATGAMQKEDYIKAIDEILLSK